MDPAPTQSVFHHRPLIATPSRKHRHPVGSPDLADPRPSRPPSAFSLSLHFKSLLAHLYRHPPSPSPPFLPTPSRPSSPSRLPDYPSTLLHVVVAHDSTRNRSRALQHFVCDLCDTRRGNASVGVPFIIGAPSETTDDPSIPSAPPCSALVLSWLAWCPGHACAPYFHPAPPPLPLG